MELKCFNFKLILISQNATADLEKYTHQLMGTKFCGLTTMDMFMDI